MRKEAIRKIPFETILISVNEVAKGSAASQLCDLDDIPLPQRLLLAYSRKIPVLAHQKRSQRSPVIDRPTGRPRSWPQRTHQPVASRIRSQAPIGGWWFVVCHNLLFSKPIDLKQKPH